MDDDEIIQELADAICADDDAPRVQQHFNPIDPVAIEIVMHEADFSVESYMEKWKGFREQLSDPMIYDDFVHDFQMRVRKDLKRLIAQAQQMLTGTEPPEDEEDWYEGQD